MENLFSLRSFVNKASFAGLIIFGFITNSLLAQVIKPQDPQYDSLKASGYFPTPEQVRYDGKETETNFVKGKTTGLLIPLDGTFTLALGPNDDGSTGAIQIPFTFEFYSTVQTAFYINNNGNISFGGPFGTYTSTGFPVSGYPMLASFWADVDTRPTASGLVYYKIEAHRVVVIWDHVGYYNRQTDKVNTFELIFTDGADTLIGVGNNVALNYADMQWTTGSASGGSGGFGGTAATAGINKGDGSVCALIGRFDHAGTDYDGPGGANDGVSFLDNQLFIFNTGTSVTNVPPVPNGFPAGTVSINIGSAYTDTVQFLAPEANQTVNTVVDYGLLTDFAYTSSPGQVSTVNFTLTGTINNVGNWSVQFAGTDDGIPPLSTAQYINFEIIDQAPTITSAPVTNILEDTPYLYDIEAADPDIPFGDSLTFQLLTYPAGMTINAQTGLVNWIPNDVQVGNHDVSVKVTDIFGKFAIQNYVLGVINVNDPPLIVQVSVNPLLEDFGEFIIPLSGIYDGDVQVIQNLVLTAVSSNLALIPDPIVNYVPNNTTGSLLIQSIPDATGLTTITLTVTDDGGTVNGGINFTTIQFGVMVMPVNDPPTINAITDPLPIPEDSGLQTISLSGIGDGDPEIVQNISVFASSSNINIIPTPTVNYIPNNPEGAISFTPVPDANGNATITLTIMDDGGSANGGVDTRQTTFNVIVTPVNDTPVSNAGPDQTVISGQLVTLDGSGSYDIDNDLLSFIWTAPPGIILSDATAVHPTFTPSIACTGNSYSFSLVVYDGLVNSLPDEITINTLPAPPDIMVNPLSLTENLMSGTSSNQLLQIKNDGFCNLSVSLSSPVSWLVMNPVSGTIPGGDSLIFNVQIKATYLYAGSYNSEITITSDDPDEPTIHIPVALTVTGIPNIVLSQSSFNFGVVFTGQPANKTLVISNNGSGNLNIGNIVSSTPDFTVDVTGFVLSPGLEQEVIITFDPATSGVINGMLTISGNDPDQPNVDVTLTGQGLSAPVISTLPASLSETLPQMQVSMQQLVISNNGGSNLTFNIVENATWLNVWPVSGTIAAGNSMMPDVSFNTNTLSPGNYSTSIKITSNDPVTPVIIIPVSLTVLEPLSVTANAAPPEICTGSSTHLHAVPHGGFGNYSYSWTSDPPGFVSTSQNPVVSPNVTTTYFVTISDGHGNASSNVTVTIYLDSGPTAVFNMLPVNNAFDLTLPIHFSWGPSVNASGYDLYIWHSNEPRPSSPVASNITQINYLFQGSGSFSYGDTCKWQIVSKNPCFQTPGPIQVFSINGLPNLHTTGITNSQPVAGQQMTISWTVKNDGNGATPPGTIWLDRVWLSPDIEVRIGEQEDILLGQFPNVSYLEPGEHYVQTQQIQIPENLMGTYFLFVIADDLDALFIDWPPSGPPLPYLPPPYYTSYSHGGSTVHEYVEHDNFFYKEISFAVPPLPDLQVTSIIPPSNVFSGQTINVTWTVRNKGDGNTNTNSWNDNLYFSQDTALNISNALNMGSLNHTGFLNPDSSYTVTKSVTIPSNIFGTYYFYVTTDVSNTVFEHVYENNNTAGSDSVVVFLTPPPDLVVTSINVPGGASNDDVLDIGWTVKNQGATSPVVTSWLDGTYLSASPDYDLTDAYFLGSTPHSGTLIPDSSYQVNKSVNLSANLSGAYYIYIHTDVNNNVFEYLDEDNNLLRSDTPINIMNPDLVVSNIVIPSANNNSQPFNIQWTVKNNGPGKVYHKTWKDRIFASASPVYHPDSIIPVAELIYSAVTLLSGESLSQTKLISLPDNLSGAYYIYVFTDGSNTVYENGNENNNTLRSSGTIQLLKPDLAVGKISVPPVDSSGMPVDITWRVTNEGQGIVYNRNWTDRIMLSYSPVYNPNSVIPIATLNYDGFINPGGSFTKEMFVTLPDSIPGPYYIFIQLDCFNQIYENLSEENNIDRSESTIQIMRPDLIAKDLVAPVSATSGTTIDVAWTTKNTGPVSIFNSSWTDRVLLSPHPLYAQGANTTLGDKVITGSLLTGDSLANQLSVNIPEGLQGDYYLHVFTDFTDNVDENINENNNITDAPIQITIGPWADLQVMNVQWPDTALAGSNIPLDYLVKNTGTKGIAGKSWVDKVYFSTVPVWDPGSATFLRAFEQSISLDPDSNYRINSTINLPAGLSAGIHYIYVFTDAENNVFEYSGENNNIRRSGPVYIDPIPPVDLAIMNISNPDSGSSGQPINIQWTVKNVKNSNTVLSWYDAVYLSTDSIWNKNTDIFFGKRLHYGALGYGESYNCSQTFYLPNGMSGDYYLLAVADYDQANNDDDLINNWRSKTNAGNVMQTINMKLTPPPDLQISVLTSPTQALTGIPFKVRWTAKNPGPGELVNGTWSDKIYLSTDYTINSGDILIGARTRTGSLGINQMYNDSVEITLPNNLSGNFIIIIKTDGDNTVYEMAESNNTKYSFIVISQPPPADLFVTDIIPPVSVVVGKSATVQWTVKNIGQNPANGTVKDLVYFSPDPVWDTDDVLFGFYQSGMSLTPGTEITRSLTAKVNDLPMGYFYAIVRTDVLNGIHENNEDNNFSASNGTLYADVRELPLGVLTADTLKNLENLYFRIPVADSLNNETMLATLKADSINGTNEMYLKHNNMPTRITYDYTSGNPYQGNQEIIVPSVQNGNNYMLLYGNSSAGNSQNINVLAEILTFEIISVEATSAGNTGLVTLKMRGSNFSPQMTFLLKKTNSILSSEIQFVDRTEVYATFNLRGADTGFYDVIAKTCMDSDTLIHSFEIIQGMKSELGLNVISPPNVRANRVTSFTIEFANIGNVNLVDPRINVKSEGGAPLSLNVEGLGNNSQELLIPLNEENGPPGILRPGYLGSVIIYTKSSGPLGFTILILN